jgi:hypothetical protein
MQVAAVRMPLMKIFLLLLLSPLPSLGSSEEINTDVKGQLTLEGERSNRYGYDQGSTTNPIASASPNFSASPGAAGRNTLSLLGHIKAIVKRDHSQLFSHFQIGEIYFGDSTTGGGGASRSSNPFKLAQLYLEHSSAEEGQWTIKGGMQMMDLDPQGLIFSDYLPGFYGSYHWSGIRAEGWMGWATKSRPAATAFGQDQYGALRISHTGDHWNNAIFFLERQQANVNFGRLVAGSSSPETLTGKNRNRWFGLFSKFNGSIFSPELMLAFNSSRFRHPSVGTDNMNSYLVSGRLEGDFSPIKASLRFLLTPGASNASDSGNRILGRRKAFSAPVLYSYWLNIATNDGWEEYPGSQKQSAFGGHNADEGLRMLVSELRYGEEKRWQAYGRFAWLASAAPSSQSSKAMGVEWNLGAHLHLSEGNKLLFDSGIFSPGAFYRDRRTASLFTTRYQMLF